MRVVRFLVWLFRYAPGGLGALLFASLFVNALFLISPIYMMHIYDSVIGARSEVNLIAISVLAVFLYFALFGFDALRSRMLTAIAPNIERGFRARLSGAISGGRLDPEVVTNSIGSLDRVQQFVLSPVIAVFLDLPFAPAFLAMAFLIHPMFGLVGLVGAAILIALAVYFGHAVDRRLGQYQPANQTQVAYTGALAAQQEFLQTTKARDFILSGWGTLRNQTQAFQQRIANDNALALAITKTLRLALQSAVLGLGAWLVLDQQLSAGAIIAASVVISRAVMPMEQTAAIKRNLSQALAAFDSLTGFEEIGGLPLPRPATSDIGIEAPSVVARNLTFQYERASRPILRNINLTIAPGTLCAVSGPTGCGKSTLLRCMLGLLSLEKGEVRLGGVRPTVDLLASGDIGYLPQQNHLFPLSILQNIVLSAAPNLLANAREAARLAGCDDAISALPEGYDTVPFVEGQCILSPGLVQAIAVARTIAQAPQIAFLDEPTHYLDSGMAAQCRKSIVALRARGATVVVVTHDPLFVGNSDTLLLFHPVAGPLFGPTKDIVTGLSSLEKGTVLAT